MSLVKGKAVAHRVGKRWKCDFCGAIRGDASTIWSHLMDEHEIGSTESDKDTMYRRDEEDR